MKAPKFVCLSALSLPGESGGDVPPAQGDELDFSGKATVSRVEGKYAYLTPTEINRQPRRVLRISRAGKGNRRRRSRDARRRQ